MHNTGFRIYYGTHPYWQTWQHTPIVTRGPCTVLLATLTIRRKQYKMSGKSCKKIVILNNMHVNFSLHTRTQTKADMNHWANLPIHCIFCDNCCPCCHLATCDSAPRLDLYLPNYCRSMQIELYFIVFYPTCWPDIDSVPFCLFMKTTELQRS